MIAPPPLRDARWLQVAVLLAYAIVAREIFHFERTHVTALLCVGWAIVLDVLVGAIHYKKVLFPLTPTIIGLACSLLLDARSALPYLGAVTLAIASKAALTYRGRHYFNPANFGVTVMLQLFPAKVTGMPSLFGGYLTPTLVFAALGVATVVWARQTAVSFSFVAGFIVFGLLRAALTGARWFVVLAPALGPAFLLFSFHMISDPSTTPRMRGHRIGFGFGVAFLDAVLRLLQVPYGSFYALFVVCAFAPFVRAREA